MILVYLLLSLVSAATAVMLTWAHLGVLSILVAPFAGSAGALVMAVICASSPASPAGGRRIAAQRVVGT